MRIIAELLNGGAMSIDMDNPKVRRRPLNVSVREDLIEAAKGLELNTSKAAEAGIAEAVRRAREAAWREQNRAAIDAHNARIDEQGTTASAALARRLMARFDVHKLKSKADGPLVVDVQADLLEALRTRLVVPLMPLAAAEQEVTARLKPVVDIAGRSYVLMTTDLGAIPTADLGERVASVEPQRQTITDALDFLFQGF